MRTSSNVNRTYLAKDKPLTSDFISDIADLRNMTVGAPQVFWTGNDNNTGTFELWVSNLPEVETFGPFPDSLYPMLADRRSILWNIGVLGFRYMYIKYVRNTVGAGTVDVLVLAKKGGGIG